MVQIRPAGLTATSAQSFSRLAQAWRFLLIPEVHCQPCRRTQDSTRVWITELDRLSTGRTRHHHTTNNSNDSSKSSLLTPTPPGCSTGESGFLTTWREMDGVSIVHSFYSRPTFGLFNLPPTVFHIEIDINLLQGDSHARGLCIGEHDKLDIGWRFKVVQLVLASSVANKARHYRE
jgi:hypothetical protein